MFDLAKFIKTKQCTTIENKKARLIDFTLDYLIVEIENPFDNGGSFKRFVYTLVGECVGNFSEIDLGKFIRHDGLRYNGLFLTTEEPKKDILYCEDLKFSINTEIKHTKNMYIFNVRSLLKLKDVELDLDVKLSNGESLQRPYVWGNIEKQEFIKSILMERYIPPITVVNIYNEQTCESVNQIIDGKQRINCVKEFANGNFPIEIDGKRYFYENLSFALKNTFNRFVFNGTYYFCFNTPGNELLLTDIEYINLFEYVNFCGVRQDLDHMAKLKSYIK